MRNCNSCTSAARSTEETIFLDMVLRLFSCYIFFLKKKERPEGCSCTKHISNPRMFAVFLSSLREKLIIADNNCRRVLAIVSQSCESILAAWQRALETTFLKNALYNFRVNCS